MRVVVTGGSGKAGTAVLTELLEHGHEVFSIDRHPPTVRVNARVVDLCDLGQAVQTLAGADAVVHLAAIPNSVSFPEGVTFSENVASTYNVFEAARLLGVTRIVWASSETIYGAPFERQPPAYVPFDEASEPRPESSYALGKLLCEEIGRQFHRRAGISSIALRLSNVLDDADYQTFPEVWVDPGWRIGNCFNYVDIRDAAVACRLALEADIQGARVVSIAAPDTVMNRPSAELMAEFYPATELRAIDGEFGSLMSSHAAGDLFGYQPRQSWRDVLGER